jgi:hypothetical protein
LNSCVVNDQFVSKLDQFLARGVAVYIGYGINKSAANKPRTGKQKTHSLQEERTSGSRTSATHMQNSWPRKLQLTLNNRAETPWIAGKRKDLCWRQASQFTRWKS